MRLSLAVLGLTIILSQSITARADDGLRCKDRLVKEGDRMYVVRALCGEPDGVFHRVESFEVQIDEWTYDLGPSAFARTVVFKNGRVADVVADAYGRKSR
jgi:hypothetical protein